MLVKEQAAHFAPRPKSFAALMDMYEINYIQLRLLCGDIHHLPEESISRIDGGVPVLLRLQENATHTSTLLLTYLFQETHERVERRPDMLIRVYHDARQAEVISHRCRLLNEPVQYWGKNLDTMLLCRWRMNRFLYKWSSYLRRQGHRFN